MICELRKKDCLTASWAVGAKAVDVIVTSPPYNIEKEDAGSMETRIENDEAYVEWLLDRLVTSMAALKDDGSLFLNISGKPSKQQLPYKVVSAMLGQGYVLQNAITWVKSITVPNEEGDGERSIGHFKPINSKRFVNDCTEPVFHFTKSGDVHLKRLAIGAPYQDKSNISRWEGSGGGDLRCRGNVWFIPHETRRAKAAHPTAFPLDLPLWAIRLHGAENPVVMDPFMGSGTTGVAAHEFGAEKFFGFDMDDYAYGLAKENLSSLQGVEVEELD